MLILGTNLVEPEFPELWKDVRVEMRIRSANRRGLALRENFLTIAFSKLLDSGDANRSVRRSVYAKEDFVQLSGRKPLCRQFFLCAENDLRSRTDGGSVSSDDILPIPAQPDLPILAEQDGAFLIPASGPNLLPDPLTQLAEGSLSLWSKARVLVRSPYELRPKTTEKAP